MYPFSFIGFETDSYSSWNAALLVNIEWLHGFFYCYTYTTSEELQAKTYLYKAHFRSLQVAKNLITLRHCELVQFEWETNNLNQ